MNSGDFYLQNVCNQLFVERKADFDVVLTKKQGLGQLVWLRERWEVVACKARL